MRKVFWDNPYQCNLITRVSSVSGNLISFDETIAFSFSGGQESDKAYINGMSVLNSEIKGNLIYYTLPEGHELSVGDTVTMEIDWPRRYRLMRLHFAAELVLELVTRKLGIEKIGAHIAEAKARIDFVYDRNISLVLESLLAEYNGIIARDAPIKTGFSDVKNQRRYWEIEGFSKVQSESRLSLRVNAKMIKKIIFLMCFIVASSTYAEKSKEPVTAKGGMVVSEEAMASEVGVNILRKGGNAIDAAVAVGYALAVVNPCCGNVGGGGFMLIHLASGKNVFLNFREKAPLRANKEMFLDAKGNIKPDATTKGYLAVAVPGTVLGLDTALQKYGTMSRQEVMAPAIKLAKDGFLVPPYMAKNLDEHTDEFRQQENVAAIFLPHGKPYQAGERLIQTDLGHTLQLIAQQGPAAFYRGEIAKKIVAASNANGGILTLADFANYKVQILEPIKCNYQGYTIFSAPPPSSGGVGLCEMLNILSYFPLKNTGYQSAQSIHYMVEAMRYTFFDRNNKLGDPDFVHNPVTQLISKKYAFKLSQKIKHATSIPHPTTKYVNPKLSDTTHYSVVDDKGNAVSVTYSLNGFNGAGVIADHTGFFLNDVMDDFATAPGQQNKFGLVQYGANTIAPGKRPLSSMAPTIILKNGRVFMVIGSPGGPRIITTLLEVILNVIDWHMNIQRAVDAPRFHYQGEPDVIFYEPDAFSLSVLTALKNRGYNLTQQHTWSAAEAVLKDLNNGILYGANDKRRPDGAALGY